MELLIWANNVMTEIQYQATDALIVLARLKLVGIVQ